MSATARTGVAAPSPFPVLPREASAALGVLLAGLIGVSLAPPLGGADALLAERAGASTAFAPGAEASLLLAGCLSAIGGPIGGLAARPALLAASWAGLPLAVGAALVLTRRAPGRGLVAALALAFSPPVWWACASGHGVAALGLLLLWAQLLAAPDRPPHTGAPLAGLGILAAAALAPGFSGLALPIFMVAFLTAPLDMARRAMIAAYLIAFLPVIAWAGTLAYARWLTGEAGAGPLPGPAPADDPEGLALLTGLAVAAACAPGLVATWRSRPAGLGAVIACAFAGLSPAVPLSLLILAAWSAQLAGTIRHGGPTGLALGTIGAGLALWLAAPS